MMKIDIFAHPLFSNLRARWFYRRGMEHANQYRNALAIADYTRVIEMTAAATHLRAKALFNRALVYHATLKVSKSINDLHAVLEMAGATGEVKLEARRKLVRMERNSLRSG